jgi:hypothetical protein
MKPKLCQCCGNVPVGGDRTIAGVRVCLDKLCVRCFKANGEPKNQRGRLGRLSTRNQGKS